MRFAFLMILIIATPAIAEQPFTAPLPRPISPYARGEKMLEAYLKGQVKQIASNCLNDLSTKEEWEKRRPELRRQFFEMMGLWPLPAKTNLRPTIAGTVDAGDFIVEKLHFQSMPDLYVTANFYLPKPKQGAAASKYPTILYVCGHGNTVENGTSFGSKVYYQYHPAWFAAHGYACLVLDTLELGEIMGRHHGTYRDKLWWWQSRGYTPAGVELWNAIRALDYLESRPEVDARRIGVTGRSGGGATSWWIAAADDRPQAIVPVAGIGDLYSHVCEGESARLVKGVISGHCDCMYMVNSYRWDFPMVAALIAPRPLLLGNSDADEIFPMAGYRRLAEKVGKVYKLYGAEDRFQLLETKGPHKDTPELRIGINKWMNRWLRNDTSTEVKDDLPEAMKPQQLKVFEKPPEWRLNETVHEVFVRSARIELPTDRVVAREWWSSKKPELLNSLREKVLAGWTRNPPPLKATVAEDITRDGVRLRAIDFVSEENVELRLFVMTSTKVEKPADVILSVLDEEGWYRWCTGLGPEFATALQLKHKIKQDQAVFAQNRAVMESQRIAFAVIAPRGIGASRWAEEGSFEDTQIRRRFALLGQTVDGQRVWDTRRAIAALRNVPDVKMGNLAIQGERDAASIALFAGLMEPEVKSFDLWQLSSTYRLGATFLNVLKILDAPQAVALALPRRIVLHVSKESDRADWDWVIRLQLSLGLDALAVKVVGE
jgi:hypothetical protein